MNLKSVTFFLFILLLEFSCSKVRKVPDDVIGQEKMGKILFEIALSEGYLENYTFKDTTANRDSFLTVELDKVLAIHKVSQKEFLEAYKFYKSSPELFKVLTDTVYNRSQRSPEKIYGARPNREVKKEKIK
ncbi:MAG: DUF4296 domain-containing protein [Chitinophagaceae bacterium]